MAGSTMLDRSLNTAAPSMAMESSYRLPYDLGQADDPESAWTAAARHALFSRNAYATEQSYDYATLYPQWVTWDYASPFLFLHHRDQPYPYVLEG